VLNDLKIFGGSANPGLVAEICQVLNVPMGKIEIKHFPDTEIFTKIDENVRGAEVFVIQPTSPPVNEHLMELLIIMDALRRASAQRITAVLPYYGYARQDRKDQPRVPVTAKLIANLITTAGADRVVTVDLHAGQIQGFFDIPVDNLFADGLLGKHFATLKLDNLMVVSPDIGSVKRARSFARQLDSPLAIIDKRRPRQGEAEVMNVIGDVEGKNIIISDDMVDSAGTLTEAVRALKNAGAKDIYAGCTHAVLSDPAIQRIMDSPLKQLVVTNTIALDKKKLCPKIKVLSIAELLAEATNRIYHYSSVSSLFV
jgi:ribose-phosphate pyrophosphokinase